MKSLTTVGASSLPCSGVSGATELGAVIVARTDGRCSRRLGLAV